MSVALHPVEEEIIRYVQDNPGCSKSDIVRFIKGKQMMGRPAVLVHIDKLERDKMIICELEKPNSQLYRIYINDNNKLASVIVELEDFKGAYLSLLEKLKEMINNKDYSEDAKVLGIKESNPNNWTDTDKQRYAELEITRLKKVNTEFAAVDKAIGAITQLYDQPKLLAEKRLLERKKIGSEVKPTLTKLENALKGYGENLYFMISNPVELFYIVVDLMFYRGMITWPEQVTDKEQLAQIYSVVYSKISEIQLILSEFIKSVNVAAFDPIKAIIDGRKRSTYPSLGIIISFYYKLGLGSEMEKVKDSIIKINQDINKLKLIEFNSSIVAAMNNPDKVSDIIIEHVEKH